MAEAGKRARLPPWLRSANRVSLTSELTTAAFLAGWFLPRGLLGRFLLRRFLWGFLFLCGFLSRRLLCNFLLWLLRSLFLCRRLRCRSLFGGWLLRRSALASAARWVHRSGRCHRLSHCGDGNFIVFVYENGFFFLFF